MADIGRKGALSTARRLRGGGLSDGELGPLDYPRDAERWLRIVGEATATGRLPNRDGQTVVRAVEAWLKAHGEAVVAKDVAELREALDALRKRGKLKALP
jgi:hypothetical protein